MRTVLQIIGTDNGESCPSILVTCDSQKYLFNVGEAAQRTCLEYKIRLGKLENIFASNVSWDRVGGLPGMLLTLAQAGNKKLNVYGPKNITHFLAACRPFVFRMVYLFNIGFCCQHS